MARDDYQPMVRAPGVESLTLEEHTRLVDAIEARDPKSAEHAVPGHLTRSNELDHRLSKAEGRAA